MRRSGFAMHYHTVTKRMIVPVILCAENLTSGKLTTALTEDL